jgi:acetyl esterase/lipase
MKQSLAGILVLILIGSGMAMILEGCSQSASSNYQKTIVNIPYASVSPSQKLDIYLPSEGNGPYPVIISIHGGAYSGGDKMGPDLLMAMSALKRGYAVVSVNYRLSGEAVFPAQIHDIKAAIRFLRANAAQYNLNPNQIACWGSSAGGQLSALAGTSGGVKALQDPSLGNADQSDCIQAVVDWCGPINFLTMDEQFKKSGINGTLQNNPDSYTSRFMGKQITQIPEMVKKANPETYITPDDPPILIQHGTIDPLVPVQQSTDFSKKLEAVLGKSKVQTVVIQGAGHDGKGLNTPENISRVLDFLDARLKKAAY